MHAPQPSRPQQYHDSPNHQPHQPTPPPGGSTASSLFSSLKGGAASLVRNVKDASSKVMETVSASIAKGEMDFSYITMRLGVMSYPAEGMEATMKNHIDDVRMFLDQRHAKSYAIYNVSQRNYRVAKFENRVGGFLYIRFVLLTKLKISRLII